MTLTFVIIALLVISYGSAPLAFGLWMGVQLGEYWRQLSEIGYSDGQVVAILERSTFGHGTERWRRRRYPRIYGAHVRGRGEDSEQQRRIVQFTWPLWVGCAVVGVRRGLERGRKKHLWGRM